MRFLRSVAGYRGTDKKRYTDIRQNLKIFNLGEKIRECQQKYFEHILIMPTYRIPTKIFNCHPNGRCRSQWPRGLRRRSAAAQLLGSRVRIPVGAWMFVSCVYMLCCPLYVEVSATGWSLVQRSPTVCLVCDHRNPEKGPMFQLDTKGKLMALKEEAIEVDQGWDGTIRLTGRSEQANDDDVIT
jgi:hypothetical protein